MSATELTVEEQVMLYWMRQGYCISVMTNDRDVAARVSTAYIPRGYKTTENGLIEAKTWYRRVR